MQEAKRDEGMEKKNEETVLSISGLYSLPMVSGKSHHDTGLFIKNSVKFKKKHRYPCKPKPLSLPYSFPRGQECPKLQLHCPLPH